MFSADKPLGDTYAVIQVAFNDRFSLDMDLPEADSASVPNCPLGFALGITCSSALSVWPLPGQITQFPSEVSSTVGTTVKPWREKL